MYHYNLRASEAFALFQKPLEVERIYTHKETSFFMLSNFCLSVEVARVNKVETENLALILVSVIVAEGNERVILM